MNTHRSELLGTSELAKAANVGRETLRFYEEKGLVVPKARTAAGYRQYSRDAIALIAFIKESQGAGFSLKEIEELLELRTEAKNSCTNVGNILQRKAVALTDEISNLHRKRSVIESMFTACCRGETSKTCALVPCSSITIDVSNVSTNQRQTAPK